MWFFIVDIIAAIAAVIRGWRAIPIIILAVSMVFAFMLGHFIGPISIRIMKVFDYVLPVILIIMAIIGRKKKEIQILETDSAENEFNRN